MDSLMAHLSVKCWVIRILILLQHWSMNYGIKTGSSAYRLIAVAGMEMLNATKVIRNNIGNGKLAEQEIRGELTRGWVGAIGGQITGPVIWEDVVEDASFTKIRELSLSYQFNGFKAIKGMEFILSGRNLFTFTTYDGYDPETNVAGQSYIRGTDYGNYPIPRVIQFSIITKF